MGDRAQVYGGFDCENSARLRPRPPIDRDRNTHRCFNCECGIDALGHCECASSFNRKTPSHREGEGDCDINRELPCDCHSCFNLEMPCEREGEADCDINREILASVTAAPPSTISRGFDDCEGIDFS
jgi:hypothetical protein